MDAIHEAASDAVQGEVYRAVREFLTSTDPDVTLDWLAVPATPGLDDNYDPPEDVAVRIVVEGRGEFAEIRRDCVLRRLVEEEIEDGGYSEERVLFLTALAEGFERLAAMIREVLK
jgi:hypothetical protein